MPESVQSCFELSIHFPVFFSPRTIFNNSSRQVRYTDKCMESSKHDWTLSSTAASLKSFQFMNFSEVMFYENYLQSDFHTNTVI